MAKGDLDRAAARLRHALQLRPDSSEAQTALAAVVEKQKTLAAAFRLRRPTTRRGWRRSKATSARRSGNEVEPLLEAYVQGAPALLLGLVRPRIRPLLPAEGRRSDTGPREVPPARRHERGSPQAARPLADGHREVRRGAARVRAGHPLQAGLRGDPLQPGPALLDAGQLAAGADGVRGGPASRPVLRRGAGRAGVRARGARRRRGGGQEVRRGDRAQPGAPGPLRLRPREPERVLQPHGQSGKGPRIRASGQLDSIPSPTAPGSRRPRPKSGRGASPRPSTRSTRPSRSIPGPRRTTTSWPVSIAGSARRTRARRRSTPSSASSASRTSWRRCAASTSKGRGAGEPRSADRSSPVAGSWRCWGAPRRRRSCPRPPAHAFLAADASRPVVFTDVTGPAGLLRRGERLGKPR